MRGKALAAAVLGVGGLVVGLGLLAREVGPLAAPGVSLADALPATLDTVELRGRRVEASLNGTVVEVGPDGRVLLAVADGAVPLRFDEAVEVAVEDRILVVGRLRARGRGRYVEVASWAVVAGSPRAPATPGL